MGDDYKCITVMNPYCAKKDRTVYDKTCRTMVNFDCKAQGGNTYGTGPSGSGDSGYGGSDGGYGESSYEPEFKCYTTPRTVSSDYCEDREEKVCEKLTEMVPVPVERQNCHDENKKVCELEERSQPKQVKKYVYTKDCRPVTKTVCDNADQMYLTPSCVPTSWKKCSYYPKEKCENIPKKHCYQVPYQIEKMHCPKDYSENYAKPHAYQDEKYQHDTYKQDKHKPTGYNRMMHGYPIEEGSQSVDLPANVMAPADPAQRE